MEHLPGAAGPTAPLEPSSVILYLSFMEIRMGTRSTPLVSEIGLVQTAHSRVHLGGVPTVSVTGATQRLSFPRHQSPGTTVTWMYCKHLETKTHRFLLRNAAACTSGSDPTPSACKDIATHSPGKGYSIFKQLQLNSPPCYLTPHF